MKPVTAEHHANKYWQRYTSYDFAAKNHVVPLVAAEIAPAVQAMALAFAKHGEKFVLVGILSPNGDENLYVGRDGRWCGSYIPSQYRSYPFGLLRIKGREHPVLCVNESSGLITEQGSAAEPFFDQDGALSKSVQDVVGFLRQVEESRVVTLRAVDALAQAELMVPLTAKITIDDKQQGFTGLYSIDAAKFEALADADFLALRHKGALAIVWGQLFSQGQLATLSRLATLREQSSPKDEDVMTHLVKDDIFHF